MSADARRPLVLVPGAWLGGWAWRDGAVRLRRLGHDDVYPVTLTGLGERVHLAGERVDLEIHVVDVVNVLDFEDLEDVVLVGHSYGGAVVTGAADRRAQPYATLTSTLERRHDRPPGVRRVGVLCSAGGLDLALLRSLIAQGDPRAAVFADDDWELHELPTGHWPMLSMPEALADLLHDVASASG